MGRESQLWLGERLGWVGGGVHDGANSGVSVGKGVALTIGVADGVNVIVGVGVSVTKSTGLGVGESAAIKPSLSGVLVGVGGACWSGVQAVASSKPAANPAHRRAAR